MHRVVERLERQMPGTLSNSNRVASRSYLLLLSFLVMGCSDISTQIVIPASPVEVWKVLVDTKGYQVGTDLAPKRG